RRRRVAMPDVCAKSARIQKPGFSKKPGFFAQAFFAQALELPAANGILTASSLPASCPRQEGEPRDAIRTCPRRADRAFPSPRPLSGLLSRGDSISQRALEAGAHPLPAA